MRILAAIAESLNRMAFWYIMYLGFVSLATHFLIPIQTMDLLLSRLENDILVFCVERARIPLGHECIVGAVLAPEIDISLSLGWCFC